MDDSKTAKRAMREWARVRRRDVTPATAVRAGETIARLVGEWLAEGAARGGPTVASALLYAALPGEVDTAPLERVLRARGVETFYPRVADARRRDGALTVHRAALDALVPSTHAIREPAADTPQLVPSALDLVVVPALAFDAGGHRLGFGGGYYDRLLARAPDAIRLGIAHAWQLVEEVPRAPHDEPVDLLVTDEDAALRPTGARPLPRKAFKEETP